MSVSHPVTRNFKSYFPDILSKKVANPASCKSPAGPLIVARIQRGASLRHYGTSISHFFESDVLIIYKEERL